MGWFDDDTRQAQNYNQVTDPHHEASWSHELIAGAAAYEAAKAYENHKAENGPPDSHATAKELLAGFAGAFIDREAETRGVDFYEREKAKRHAREQLEETYDNRQNDGHSY